MNGAGNDFILLDNRQGQIQLSAQTVVTLCHRQRGIGADGLLMLVPARGKEADWAWDFYNSDGSQAEMCGNGARCFARFIQKVTGQTGPVRFETGAGIIRARFHQERVTVNLTAPRDMRMNQVLEIDGREQTVHSVNTGVPHAVLFVPNADQAMVEQTGPKIRHHPHFAPRGTNVNFVQLHGPSRIRVRTYERGVEGETLACGTGVTASALVSATLNHFKPPVQVEVQGGDTLEVSFEGENGSFQKVELTGPADFVFEGRIEVKGN